MFRIILAALAMLITTTFASVAIAADAQIEKYQALVLTTEGRIIVGFADNPEDAASRVRLNCVKIKATSCGGDVRVVPTSYTIAWGVLDCPSYKPTLVGSVKETGGVTLNPVIHRKVSSQELMEECRVSTEMFSGSFTLWLRAAFNGD